MKRILSYSVVIISLGLTAPTAFSQTTANGPYYATPSWDQTLPVATRFIVLSNMNSEAVLDRETGLVWQRAPSTTDVTFPFARSQCLSMAITGRKGWRLPSVTELTSLVDVTIPPAPNLSFPMLPTGHPFIGVRRDSYWTSTTVIDDSTWNWSVNFEFGSAGQSRRIGDPIASNLVWCVRGPVPGWAH